MYSSNPVPYYKVHLEPFIELNKENISKTYLLRAGIANHPLALVIRNQCFSEISFDDIPNSAIRKALRSKVSKGIRSYTIVGLEVLDLYPPSFETLMKKDDVYYILPSSNQHSNWEIAAAKSVNALTNKDLVGKAFRSFFHYATNHTKLEFLTQTQKAIKEVRADNVPSLLSKYI